MYRGHFAKFFDLLRIYKLYKEEEIFQVNEEFFASVYKYVFLFLFCHSELESWMSLEKEPIFSLLYE